MLSEDVELCKICGKKIHFSMHMTRGSYTYKIGNKYFCGYNHYNEGKKIYG